MQPPWLRELIADNLIAPGIVDTRSIKEIQPSDLNGFAQCHFFAGIGGWSYALRLAGWPDDERSDGPRRISAQPNAFPMAHGVSARMGKLRGSGNAIVPQLAAQFIQACVEAIRANT